MATAKRSEYVEFCAVLFVMCLITIAVMDYVSFCVQNGSGAWVNIGLVCWGILIACSEKYVLWLVDYLARKFSARFDSDS
jgi:hypothetical protein